jgi:hypothetical protein
MDEAVPLHTPVMAAPLCFARAVQVSACKQQMIEICRALPVAFVIL